MLAREAIGAVLRDQRNESVMTLRTLARRSGVSMGYISEVERGIKEISSEMLEDLCICLDITMPELFMTVSGVMQDEGSTSAA